MPADNDTMIPLTEVQDVEKSKVDVSLEDSDDDDSPLLQENVERITAKSCLSTSRILICLLVIVLITTILTIYRTRATKTDSWNGFDHIGNYFAFGDSWTDTRFRLDGLQPSLENPLGNPPFPGRTSSNGLNYVGYLATKYNQSFLRTYNLGYSGATVDSTIDVGYFDWDDFTHRIKDFVQYYTLNGTAKGWRPNNTLFSMFYGINDFNIFNKKKHNLNELFAIYEKDISDLYSLSARNFLVMNVPPVDRSPLWEAGNHEDAVTIQEFNEQVKAMCQRLRKKYSDIVLFEYDSYDLVSRVIQDPNSVPQTARYKNTKGYCIEYDGFENTVPTAEQIEACGGLEPNDFLWLNTLHVTEPVHEAMAAEIAKLFGRGP